MIERVPCWVVMCPGESLAIVAATDATAAATTIRRYGIEAESVVRLHDETRLVPGIEIVWAPDRAPEAVN